MESHPRTENAYKSQRRYRAVLELASIDKTDHRAALREILATDSECLSVERVSCWELDQEARKLTCVERYTGSTGDFSNGTTLCADRYPRYFHALSQNPLIMASDVLTDPRSSEMVEDYLGPQGIGALMDVPIWVGGRLWGVLCHEHVGPPRQWTDSERDFALSMGHIISMTIEAHERINCQQQVRWSELFVGVLGHDIRNPLTVIGNSSEFLLDHFDDETIAKNARRILSATRRIDRMVDQLLDFTRIRLGPGLPVSRAEVDLSRLGSAVLDEMAVSHPRSKIDLRCIGDMTGHWDEDQLWHLLANMIGNAVDHSALDATVSVTVDGEDTERVVVRVRNAGAIPKELAPLIFEPFRLVKAEAHRRGLGLGLFISREVVSAHGGTIELVPSDEETLFVVTLPRGR